MGEWGYIVFQSLWQITNYGSYAFLTVGYSGLNWADGQLRTLAEPILNHTSAHTLRHLCKCECPRTTSHGSLHQKSYIPSIPSTAVSISSIVAAVGYSVHLFCCLQVRVFLEKCCKCCFRSVLPAFTYSCFPTPHTLPLNAVSPLIWSPLQPKALDSGFAHTEIPLYGPIRIRKEGSFTLALNPFRGAQKELRHTGGLKERKGGIYWSIVYSI